MATPRTDLGAPPASATLIDDDASRPSRAPVVAGALLASAALFVAVLFMYRPVPPSTVEAPRSFLDEAPAVPGASPPELASALAPELPEAIGGSPFRGDVLVGAVVAPSGEAVRVEVVRSLDPALDAVARRAVAKARFRPARKDGVAIEGRVVVPVHFEPF